jgi:hypothetical protein
MAEKKFVKIYKKPNYKIGGEEQLHPVYARVRNPEHDIHFPGKTVTIEPGKSVKTGFAGIGFPLSSRYGNPMTPLQKREAFMDLLYTVYDDAVGSDPSATGIYEVLGDDWVDELDDFVKSKKQQRVHDLLSEYYMLNNHDINKQINKELGQPAHNLSKHNMFMANPLKYIPKDNELTKEITDDYEPIYLSGNEHNNLTEPTYKNIALERDSDAEFRAGKITPIRELNNLAPLNTEQTEKAIQRVKALIDENPNISKKDILKEMRKVGMSPYALMSLSFSIDNDNFIEDNDDPSVHKDRARQALLKGNRMDYIRNIFNEIAKNESDYESDLRLKNIIPALRRRF